MCCLASSNYSINWYSWYCYYCYYCYLIPLNIAGEGAINSISLTNKEREAQRGSGTCQGSHSCTPHHTRGSPSLQLHMPLTSRKKSPGLKTNITKTELRVCEHWSPEPGGSHCTSPSQYTQQRRKGETGYAYRMHKVRLKGSNKTKNINGEMTQGSKNQ